MSKRIKNINKKLGYGAAGLGLASGATIGTLATTQNHTPDYSHLLVKDKAINEIPIIMAHNANTYPSSGTVPIWSNQSLNITDTLDKTPTRGFELDIYKHNGNYIINHSDGTNPIIDYNVSKPVTLEDSLNQIDTWLQKPENADEMIFIKLQNELNNPNDVNNINQMIADKFGDRIFTPTEYNGSYFY